MKKFILNYDTFSKSDLQKVYCYSIYPRDPIITTSKGLVNIDNGEQKGTNWICFFEKISKSFYFDSCGGSPDKFVPNFLPKPIFCHNNNQDINRRLGGT